MLSDVRMGSRVPFPAHIGERIYMLPFERKLPAKYARWQPTVDAMLSGVDHDGRCYLMVDQGTVEAGKSQRRPGLHVDGNWVEELNCHGGGHRHRGHGHPPPPPKPNHVNARGRWDQPKPSWNHFQYAPEAIVLAADVLGAVAYAGEFKADIGPGGEVETDVSRMDFVPLTAGLAWIGNVTMLHESIPLPARTQRTVVRINAPQSTSAGEPSADR